MLAAGYTAADLGGRSAAENQLARALRSKTHAGAASATISSFPFLFDLLVRGDVSEVDVQLLDVPIGKLEVSRVLVLATDLQIDRHALFSSRKVRVTSIASAKVQVTVTAAELSKAIGRRVALQGPDTIKVAVGPIMLPATIGIADGHLLTLGEGGLRLLDIDLSTSPAIPRCAMTLVVTSGSATLSCRVAPVPASLVSAISAKA
ncbi:MAG: DUF2993 domain-containing protein [Acidimicrobiales bacterium]